jgi:hypothetical protein
MTETHDYERRREISQWYSDASGWHREMNETTPQAVREAIGKLIRCALQMMLRHADEVRAASAEVERLRADMREAMELIAQVNENHMPHATWLDARDALLAKRKETP